MSIALICNVFLTEAGERPGCFWSSNATIPATCGVECEVPWSTRQPLALIDGSAGNMMFDANPQISGTARPAYLKLEPPSQASGFNGSAVCRVMAAPPTA